MVVEDKNAGTRDVSLSSSFEGIREEFRLDYQGLDLGGFKGVGEFKGSMGGVDASEDAAESEDA